MQVKANAKINLGLNILRKRDDGYHEIESIFSPISWCDFIEIKEAESVNFTTEGISIPSSEKGNLCLQAYELLKREYDLPPLHIHLNKQIPIGAGLGGGSSDAAFVLKALNQKYDLKLTVEQLETYAAQLGSDCVFFIRNQSALVKGRGELIKPSAKYNVLKTYHLLMIMPDLFISTKVAYQNVQPKLAEKPIEEIIQLPIEEWKYLLKNDFESALFPDFPLLREVKQKLYEAGAIYASMSGSGACFFGVFKEREIDLPPFKNCLKKWVEII